MDNDNGEKFKVMRITSSSCKKLPVTYVFIKKDILFLDKWILPYIIYGDAGTVLQLWLYVRFLKQHFPDQMLSINLSNIRYVFNSEFTLATQVLA